jgi:hypothetical protein
MKHLSIDEMINTKKTPFQSSSNAKTATATQRITVSAVC